MTFLAPGWLVMGAVSSVAVLALHLLNRQRLSPRPFSTARFVPEAPVRAVSRTWQPTDVALLILRVATVSLIGVGLARPALPPGRHTAVIVLVDRSPAADSADIARAVASLPSAPDTVISMSGLSAGFLGAHLAGARLSGRADSVELVVVSPLRAGLWDAATESIRHSWRGRVRLIRTAPRRDSGATGVDVDAAPDHPVRAALARLGVRAGPGLVRLRWPSTPAIDTATGVYAAGAALVGRLPRFSGGWRTGGTAVAWFIDGSPAVVEYSLGQGCERVVGFGPDAGDGLIRAAGLRIVERLVAPCGTGWTPDLYLPADSARVSLLAGAGPLASAQTLGPDPGRPITLLPLVLALILLGGERFLRRRTP